MRERRIVFVNRYFFPDHSATSQLLSDLAFHLAALGTALCWTASSLACFASRASFRIDSESFRNSWWFSGETRPSRKARLRSSVEGT